MSKLESTTINGLTLNNALCARRHGMPWSIRWLLFPKVHRISWWRWPKERGLI